MKIDLSKYKKMSSNEIKNYELNILKVFDDFAKKNNLNYCLAYGTLLGSIRHKGFIPWDDDIDIFMLRKDYDKLLTLMKSNNNIIAENIKFESYETSNYYYPFAKVCDSRTITISPNTPYNESLWIDIFPLDNVSENSKINFLKIKIYQKMIISKLTVKYNGWVPYYKHIIKKMIKFLLFPIPVRFFTKSIIKIAKKDNDDPSSKMVGDICWGSIDGSSVRMPIAYFDKFDSGSFENCEFPIISQYHEYLALQYGDYMKLPPENKRITHSLDAYVKLD